MPTDDTHAQETLDRFVRRFGEPYRLLAYHAALPLVLTPELLGYLWSEFLRDQVPWVAQVDLLLSDLCSQIGYEQYTMAPAMRAHLLRQMRRELGAERMQAVARLLIHYVRQLSRTTSVARAHELQAQQWAAMVYLDEHRENAAREIVAAFQGAAMPSVAGSDVDTSMPDQTELARLSSIVQELAPQLEVYPDLVAYAEDTSRILNDPTGSTAPRERTRIVMGVELVEPEMVGGKNALQEQVPKYGPIPTEKDIRHQHELLGIYRGNVQHYLLQAGAHGGELFATPPVYNGLREARRQIAQIKQNLRGWGQIVEDLPIDVASSTAHSSASQPAPPSPAAAVAEALPPYDRTQQPWYVDRPPAIQRLPRVEAVQWRNQIKVLLLTVNENEFFAVGRLLQPLPPYKCVRQVTFDNETYYLGRYGVYNTVVAKSRMGSAGPGAAMQVTQKAQDLWKPWATIAVGVAFGLDPGKQQLGDVLIAREIIPYNPIRAGTIAIERAQRLAADVVLYNRFDNAYDWEFRLPNGRLSRLFKGTVLSGEELIDNAVRTAELVQRFPEAIGGEMEGTGLSAASYERRPWILVKAICDWADGAKNSYHQPLAAAAAASLVQHVLSDPDALSDD